MLLRAAETYWPAVADAPIRDAMSVKIETWACARAGEETENVTEGLSAYVAVDEDGKPREVPKEPSA